MLASSSRVPRSALHIEEIPLGSPRIRLFERFPWRLYRDDPCWTPPLKGDLLGSRLLGLTGLLTPKHPYHRHAEVTHFLAWKNGTPVGRISAAVNRRFNDYYNTRTGFFGFWDVIDDYDTARELFNRACGWAMSRGMTLLRGPGDYSNATHERQGVLIDGFEYPPTVELTHNHPYYPEFLDRYGFRKAKDYYAYSMDVQTPVPPRLEKLSEQVKQRRDVETRPLIFRDLDNEIKLIVRIYNDTWSQNWGFLPVTDDEASMLANSLRLIVDPNLVWFAFVKGEPAAVLGAFPDPNVALRPRWRWFGDSDLVRVARLLLTRRRIPSTRLMFFGIRPGFRNLGIDAILYEKVKNYAVAHGYQKCEASLLLEDNNLILRPSEFMGAKKYKTWRIYDLPL